MKATTDTTATSSVHFTTSPPEKIGTKRSAWESNEESPAVLVPNISTTDAKTARFLARSSSCSSVSSTTSRDSLILPPKRASRERRNATRADGSRSPSTKAKLWEQQHYKSLPEDFLVGFDDDVDRQTRPSSSIKKSTSLLSMSLSSGEDKLLKRSHDRRRQHMEQKKKQIMSASMSSPSLISLSSLSGGGSSSSSGLSCTGSTLPAIKPIKEEEVSEDSEDEGFYIGGGDEDDDENKMEDDDDDLLFQQMKKKQQTLLNKINKMQATITASVSSPSLSSLPALLSITNSHHQRRLPKFPTKSILKNSPSQHAFTSSQLSSSSSESESESQSSKPERRKKRNKKMKKIKVNNNDTTETTEAIGSIKMIQLNDTTEDSVRRSKRRLRTNISSSSNNSTNSISPSMTSDCSIQKTSTVLSRKHRDSALDLQSFMIKRINKNGGDAVDKSLRASATSLISLLTVKDGDDDEGGPTVEDIMYTTTSDPIHNADDDDDSDDDLDSVGEYNEDDEALSQCTSRSWSLFERALELEKKVLESYENL